jgi:hypothetical protein
MYIIHDHLFLLRAEVVLAPLNRAAPVRASTEEVVLAMLVSQPDDTSTLSFCRTKVVRGLAILVKMARHLTVMAGVTAMVAGEASSFSILWGGCASSEAVGLHLIVLTPSLAELWALPYKGPEAAGSVSPNEVSSYLLLALSVLPPLVFVTKSLLSHKDFEALNVTVLTIKLVRPSPAVPESNHICIYPVISQSFQSPVKGTVHHMGLS